MNVKFLFLDDFGAERATIDPIGNPFVEVLGMST